MRPRHRRRGEHLAPAKVQLLDPGFNAATASTPWRTPRSAGTESGAGTGFNAATASTPWRTQGIPLFFRQPQQLQCGHGIDAVENTGEAVEAEAGKVLQCG